jgi:hypothetical protein
VNAAKISMNQQILQTFFVCFRGEPESLAAIKKAQGFEAILDYREGFASQQINDRLPS